MNIAELFKKNFILVPVIASVMVGTFTGVKYVVNLTDTINASEQQIVNIKRDLSVSKDQINDLKTRLSAAEATWTMAENLYEVLADKVREHDYDIKDLNR
jgi:chromosome segregation ATPase